MGLSWASASHNFQLGCRHQTAQRAAVTARRPPCPQISFDTKIPKIGRPVKHTVELNEKKIMICCHWSILWTFGSFFVYRPKGLPSRHLLG